MIIDDSEIEWIPYGIDTLIERKIKEASFGRKIFCTVFRGEVSETTKRFFLNWLIAGGWISIQIGNGKAKEACSELIHLQCIDHFLRTCCAFKNNSQHLPREFLLGRTLSLTPIIIVVEDKFVWGIRYDEAIRHPFLYFCLFSYLGI